MALGSSRVRGDSEQALLAAFVEEGWQVEGNARRKGSHGAHAVVRRDPLRYAIDLKIAPQARLPVLEGLLAAAILRARRAAQEVGAAPLAIVAAPLVSERALEHLRKFAEVYGEGSPWGVVDERGLLELFGPGLENLERKPARRVRGGGDLVPRSFGLFSDLSQWMLKVLLSHRLPANLRILDKDGRPVSAPVLNAAALARHAGVSVPSAARLVVALRNEGFCDRGEPLQLNRVDELLSRWRAALAGRPAEVRAKWLFPASNAADQLEKVLVQHQREPGRRACFGLFEAARRLGFDFVSGVSPHVFVESLSDAVLHELGLVPAEAGERVDVFVRVPRFPESVFRGSRRLEGVPASDVLQCWLDVADHPARGSELAEYLFERVIGPSVVGKD